MVSPPLTIKVLKQRLSLKCLKNIASVYQKGCNLFWALSWKFTAIFFIISPKAQKYRSINVIFKDTEKTV